LTECIGLELKTELQEAEAHTRFGGVRDTDTGTERIKLPSFDWITFWAVFHLQLEAMVGNKN
jgi:hypothetical protein